MKLCTQIERVEKTVDDFTVGPIDLDVELGTITALIGNNGAGKSTLIKMMMNLVKPDNGNLIHFGTSVMSNDQWKQEVAYQPQSVLGCDSLTGNHLRDLMAPWYANWDQEMFMNLVKTFEIDLNKPFGKMSKGMQQKLNLVLALSKNTKLLLLDEPTANIDIPSKQKLMNIFVDWMEKDERAMVIATHNVDDIKKLADYIVIMNEGKLLGKYEKEELVYRYKRYWFEDPMGIDMIPGEVDRLNERLLISSDTFLTDAFLEKKGLKVLQTEVLDIEETITYMLSGGKRR
ncbi:ABC transporter ATP-binding protein [Fictibacillus nanhaiensis]|uniref:ABC transporter ATP-binding protein n=1 Tax=Fictibacillus nanhaiensis TaxID=742169 RepID=UPI002E1F419D|nr:ABC transporter ATP-binding protein [Fictibacillus nanhaiensis]